MNKQVLGRRKWGEMKLYRKTDCKYCNGRGSIYIHPGNSEPCTNCGKSGKTYKEVDPADLNLGYYGAWKNLTKILKIWKLRAEKNNNLEHIRDMEDVLEEIADLESGLDLGKMRKIREKARAWDWLYRETKLNKDDAPIGPIEILQSCDEILAQAQAELEAEGKEIKPNEE